MENRIHEGYSLRQFVKYFYEVSVKEDDSYSTQLLTEKISVGVRAIRNYCKKIGLQEFFEEYNTKHNKQFLNWEGWYTFFHLLLWFYKKAPKSDQKMITFPPYNQSTQIRNVYFVLEYSLFKAIKSDTEDSEYFLQKFHDSDFFMRHETAIIYENFINNLQKFSAMVSSRNTKLTTSEKRNLIYNFEKNMNKVFHTLQGISEEEVMKQEEAVVSRINEVDFYGMTVTIGPKQSESEKNAN